MRDYWSPVEQAVHGTWVVSLEEARPVETARGSVGSVVTSVGRQMLAVRRSPPDSGPATSAGDNCGVVFDGALYNRANLAAELGHGAVEFNDAELVRRAYLRWGERLLERVKGIFALVIWDGSADALLCARDPVGVYPLFYAHAGRELHVSPSIDALLRRPGVSSAISRAVLAGHLIHHWRRPYETHFTAIRRVPSGHAMRVRDGASVVYRYWDPVPPDQPVRWVTEEELPHIAELLDQAVERCLGFGPTGIFLSGGIDSGGIATIAADVSRRLGLSPPQAFGVDFLDPRAPEGPIQRGVASALGLSLTLRRFPDLIGEEGLLGLALARTSTWPWPVTDPGTAVYDTFRLETRARGCRVLLGGEGGDELFVVRPAFAAQLWSRLDLPGLVRLARFWERSYMLPRGEAWALVLWHGGARPLLAGAVQDLMRRGVPRLLALRRRSTILEALEPWMVPDPSARRELRERVERTVDEEVRAPQPADLHQRALRPLLSVDLEEEFEAWRRTGVRMLHPYWDVDVVDFMLRVPPALLTRDGRTKPPIRAMLAERFPSLGFDQQRKLQIRVWFRDAFLEEAPVIWQKIGGASTLAALGLVAEPKLGTAMADWLTGRRFETVYRMWDVLNLESWTRPRL